MKNPFRRRADAPEPPRPDYTQIALLEHDIYGVQPPPMSAAAAIIGLRQIANAGVPAASFRPGGVILPPGAQYTPLLGPDEEVLPPRRA